MVPGSMASRPRQLVELAAVPGEGMAPMVSSVRQERRELRGITAMLECPSVCRGRGGVIAKQMVQASKFAVAVVLLLISRVVFGGRSVGGERQFVPTWCPETLAEVVVRSGSTYMPVLGDLDFDQVMHEAQRVLAHRPGKWLAENDQAEHESASIAYARIRVANQGVRSLRSRPRTGRWRRGRCLRRPRLRRSGRGVLQRPRRTGSPPAHRLPGQSGPGPWQPRPRRGGRGARGKSSLAWQGGVGSL